VAWVGPAPRDAKVVFTDEGIFRTAALEIGPDVPKNVPKEYRRRLLKAEFFNPNMFWDIEELLRWHERHGFPGELAQDTRAVLEDYLNTDYALFGTLLQHPPVENPEQFAACSVVLQRAVIIYDGERESLFRRSYFHSADGSGNFVNFVPRGGVGMSFASETIWFPLRLTEIIEEPASYVVLDILTPGPLDDLQRIQQQLPGPLQAVQVETELGTVPGQMEYEGRNYHVTRIAGQLSRRERWEDLNLAV
jgi:hypothetical protein